MLQATLNLIKNLIKTIIICVRSSLDRLIADNFPLKSTEFAKGSAQFRDYTAAIDRVSIENCVIVKDHRYTV